MPRLSTVDESGHPELASAIARIRSGRGGRLVEPYDVLLHSPDIAMAWLEQLSAVKSKTALDGVLREIVILRVGFLNRCAHSTRVHASTYAPREGMSAEQIAAVEEWRTSELFDAAQRAALAYVDAMTVEIDVPAAVDEAVQRYFSERQIVELTVLIGTYNMLTRVCKALRIGEDALR